MDKPPRVLIVEDSPVLSLEYETICINLNLEVVGPAPSLRRAEELIESEEISCALFDIHLQDGLVFPLLDKMNVLKIPFILLSGTDGQLERPEKYNDVQVIPKPVTEEHLTRLLLNLIKVPAYDHNAK